MYIQEDFCPAGFFGVNRLQEILTRDAISSTNMQVSIAQFFPLVDEILWVSRVQLVRFDKLGRILVFRGLRVHSETLSTCRFDAIRPSESSAISHEENRKRDTLKGTLLAEDPFPQELLEMNALVDP